MTTRDRILQVVAEVLERSEDNLEMKHRFVQDLGATSLDVVSLVMRVEEVFGLGEVPEDQLEKVETVGDLVQMVDVLRLDEPSEAIEGVDVAIASNHAGLELKAKLGNWLRERGYTVLDMGPNDAQSVDYPDFAELLGKKVASRDATRGILVCGSGIGMSIAANKVDGVRAAMVTDPLMAHLAREHNDANVLCLGSRLTGVMMAEACVEEFLETDFDPGDDGRHRRRVLRISDISKKN